MNTRQQTALICAIPIVVAGLWVTLGRGTLTPDVVPSVLATTPDPPVAGLTANERPAARMRSETSRGEAEVPALPTTLLERAQAGDARAQFRLSERIRGCRPMVRLAERGSVRAIPEAEECQREGIPMEGDQEWRDKAIAANDPIALLHVAAFESKDEAQFAEAAEIAARSGDPEAYIALGQLLLTIKGTDPIDGMAWMIVGCPDCMADDPRLGFSMCVEFGTCPSNMRFVDWVATEEGALGPVQEAVDRAESLRALYGITP